VSSRLLLRSPRGARFHYCSPGEEGKICQRSAPKPVSGCAKADGTLTEVALACMRECWDALQSPFTGIPNAALMSPQDAIVSEFPRHRI